MKERQKLQVYLGSPANTCCEGGAWKWRRVQTRVDEVELRVSDWFDALVPG